MTFDWHYLVGLIGFADFWRASATVVVLSVMTWLAGTFFGLLLALARRSTHAALRRAAGLYVWFFRSLPLLVLLIFVYNLPQLVPALGELLSNPFAAGLVALILSESAYFAEIHRGGLIGVAPGQDEAARSLGIGYVGRQARVIVPQAFRLALPSLGNEFVTVVKLTSLVSVISLTEILLVGQRLYTQNFKVLETLAAVAFYYVLIVTVFDQLIGWLEHRFDVARSGAGCRPAVAEPRAEALPALPRQHRQVPADAPVVLELRGVRKVFHGHAVLDGVNLSVRRGEIVCVIGPSGSGKSTLIRTANGLERPDGGDVRLNGEPLSPAHGAAVGMVFQSFNLFPHLTVLQNLTLAPRYHRRGTLAEVEAAALQVLDKVGMRAHAAKYPHQLSGGQQQRAAIARALVLKPQLMLFDEPTSALDPELVTEVLRVIEALASEGITMVIVTHEMKFAFSIADRIVFMEGGGIAHQGSPAAIRTDPSSRPRIEQFLSSMANS